jgi:hypothetical protein
MSWRKNGKNLRECIWAWTEASQATHGWAQPDVSLSWSEWQMFCLSKLRDSWIMVCLSGYRTVSKDAHARRAVIAKVAMTTGLYSLLGWLVYCYFAELTGSSARCWNIDMWLCCLLTLETCIQSFICEVCLVNLELLFTILNIYLFL